MPIITLLDGPGDDSTAKAVDLPWEDWVKVLSDVQRTHCEPCAGHACESKKGRAWVPARFVGSKRVDSQVAAITMAVFDLDAPTTEQMEIVAGALHGTAYLAHETHAAGSYRLVIPLLEEVPAASWLEVWDAIVGRFHLPADPTCRNLSHLYFLPSKPDEAEYKLAIGQGAALDWRALDPVFPAGAAGAVSVFKAAGQDSVRGLFDPTNLSNLRGGDINLEELRRSVSSMRRPESRAMLDTILSGRRLTEHEPSDVGFRDSALIKACALIATCVPDKPYPADAVVALLHGSIRAMDTEPEGLDAWLELARQKYLRKVAERLERDANSEADKAAMMRVLGVGSAGVTTPEDWRRELIWGPLDKNGNPSGLRQCGSNAGVILQNAPEFKSAIRFNALSREIEVRSGPLQGSQSACLDVEAKNWLAHSEFKLFISTFEVREQLLAAARRQEYDPLREWLEALPAWNGQDYVSGFFSKHFSGEGDPTYLRAISRCFLISMIARAMKPGCEVHTAPILVGDQGIGKSRALRALGQPFFTDSKINMGDKDSQMLISGHWLVELAELAGWRAVDNETIKGFISRPEDKFRPPYGHVQESFPRRCVFVGTTNEREMLSDQSGNRRWWPINVGEIDVNRISRDRDQIFAQALAMYRQGFQWHLSPVEQGLAAAHAERFTMPASARAEQIVSWFAAKPIAERPPELSIYDLLSTVFAIPSAQVTRVLQMDGARALGHLGFEKVRKRIGGTLRYMYVTPNVLLQMGFNAKPTSVELVPKDGTN